MKRLAVIVLTVGLTVIGLLLLWQFRPTLILFGASLTLTAVLRPLVARLEQRGLKRSIAILLLYVGMIAVAALLAATALLYLQSTLDVSLARVSDGYGRLITLLGAGSIFQLRLARAVPDPSRWFGMLLPSREDGSLDLLGLVGALGSELVFLLAALALAFYWLMEVSRFERLLLSLLPAQARLKTHAIWQDVEATVGSYVRTMTVTIFVATALLFPIFVAVRMPFALLLAAVAGLAHLVPRIGPLLGLVPALVVGALASPATGGLALVGGGIAQYIAHIIGMGALRRTSVKVNPLLQVLLLMALVQLAGVWAMVLAPPLAAMIQEVYPHLVARPAPAQRESEELNLLASELDALADEIPADDRELSGALKRSGELMTQARDVVAQA